MPFSRGISSKVNAIVYSRIEPTYYCVAVQHFCLFATKTPHPWYLNWETSHMKKDWIRSCYLICIIVKPVEVGFKFMNINLIFISHIPTYYPLIELSAWLRLCWWWGYRSEVYPFIAIILRYNLTWTGSTCLGLIYGSDRFCLKIICIW